MKTRISLFIISFFCLFFPVITQAGERNLDEVNLITRSQWWADESIRYKDTYADQSNPNTSTEAKDPDTKSAEISAVRSTYMKMNFPNDWRYDKTVNVLDGHLLIYPDQINNHKTKIVIHHTATVYDQSRGQAEAVQAVQQIYKYHTLDRDFGDIGYNFLIDHLGNIYEGRAGGEGAAGMHVSYNNVATLGISLLGNFEDYSPTQAQLNALTDLITVLSKKYSIDPTASEFYFQPSSTSPYMVAKKLSTIAGHGDIAATACPGKFLKALLPFIRTEIKSRLSGNAAQEVVLRNQVVQSGSTSVVDEVPAVDVNGSVVRTGTSPVPTVNVVARGEVMNTGKTFPEKLASLQKNNSWLLGQVLDLARGRYKGALPKATNKMEKIETRLELPEMKLMTRYGGMEVLLYELTTKYTDFQLRCQNGCSLQYVKKWDTKPVFLTLPSVRIQFKGKEIFLNLEQGSFAVENVIVMDVKFNPSESTDDDALVQITNYDRKSYAGILRNTFRGWLTFTIDTYVDVNGKEMVWPIVKNHLHFFDYMKGIVETNDQETLEKNKVMSLIAKNYALFYMEKKHHHPSIPEYSAFTAIDSPEMFQKYVGAWAEKTLTKRYEALEATKNQVVMYNWILPILPYFSCSAGFTLSAEEKRGWTDTPWLKSVYDFSGCKEFAGHGVGLAGQGAEWFAKQGMKAEEILQWYYPGVEVVSL